MAKLHQNERFAFKVTSQMEGPKWYIIDHETLDEDISLDFSLNMFHCILPCRLERSEKNNTYILSSNENSKEKRTPATQPAVPYACAQPYHPSGGSHGQLFRPIHDSSAEYTQTKVSHKIIDPAI